MRSLNEHMEELNESQGSGSKQSKDIEKFALELIKRGETEKVKDKKGNVNKLVLPNGIIEYRNDKGQLHRVNGPAVEKSDGYKAWYLKGDFHREDGPAVEWADGSKWWYLNGQFHREDGPALDNANGYKTWYLYDRKYSEKQFNDKMNK